MLLLVRKVSTVILHTEMRWENAIEKIHKCNSSAGLGLGSDSKKATQQTQWANFELRTLKTRQNSNQMIHKA